MTASASAYSPAEIEAIAGWLRETDSAAQIAAKFCSRFHRHVSRSAIVGLVHRNSILKAIGFAGPASMPGKPSACSFRPEAFERTSP